MKLLVTAVSFTFAAYTAVRLFLRDSPLEVDSHANYFFPASPATPPTTATNSSHSNNNNRNESTASFLEGPRAVLDKTCPRIPVNGKQVRVLSHPSQFFEELTQQIQNAQERIVISALYVGDGKLSKQFVQCLEDAIVRNGEAFRRRLSQRAQSFGSVTSMSSSNLFGADSGTMEETTISLSESPPSSSCAAAETLSSKTKKFKMTILFDYNRMHDRRNLVTVRRLAQLAFQYRRFVDVQLHLFQTPVWLNAFLPGRSKELLGVQHTKIFVFDHKNVIVTGANLSDDYFTTRMDRYLVLEGNEALGSWLTELVESLGRLSHPVVVAPEDALAEEEVGVEVMLRELTPLATPVRPQRQFTPTCNASPPPPASPATTATARRHTKSNLLILPNACGADPARQTHEYCRRAAQEMDRFRDRAILICQTAEANHAGGTDAVDTWVYPTVQFGRVGVHHDACVVAQLLESFGSPSTEVYLTSPYLNMYSEFVQRIIQSKSQFTFITASIHTNGWKGQRGFAGTIPYFYLQVERAFYFLMKGYGCTPRVQVREFSEPGMTFHSKGMWVLSPTATTATTGSENVPETDLSVRHRRPSLAAYGSTNYGNRSVHKDVEAEVFVYTTYGPLQDAMAAELERLLAQSTTVTDATFVGNQEGRFQPVISLIAQVGLDYM